VRFGILGTTRVWRDGGDEIDVGGPTRRALLALLLVRPGDEVGQGVAKWMVPENRFVAWFVNQNYKVLPYLPWKGLMAKSIRKTAGNIDLTRYDGAAYRG
jgi:hypothetical protein